MFEEEGDSRPHMFVATESLQDEGCSGYLLCLSRKGKEERDMTRDVTSAPKRTETMVPNQKISGLAELYRPRLPENTGLVIQKRILGRG